MGQCVSRKGAHALARSSTSRSPPTLRRATSTRSTTAAMHHKHSTVTVYSSLRSPSGTNENKGATKRNPGTTRGTAMSFGFRRRPVSASQVILQDNSKPSDIDSNGNGRETYDTDVQHISQTDGIGGRIPSGRKETSQKVLNRFGFKPPTSTPKSFTNKVSDARDAHIISHNNIENKNNNLEKVTSYAPTKQKLNMADQNKNKQQIQQHMPSKYKLYSTNLPRPQMPVRLSDKNAKQVANHSRRQGTHAAATHDDSSSKEGSVTEDSGVSSHTSDQADLDSLHSIRMLDASPTSRTYRRQRQLEMVVKGKHFDVRDLNDDGTVIESTLIPLPKLPSVFQTEPQQHYQEITSQPRHSLPNTTGLMSQKSFVRDRSLDYQRMNTSTSSTTTTHTLSSQPDRMMSYSSTSEESTEEKVRRDRSHNEKALIRSPHSTERHDVSPVSSDGGDCGGEAMIDNYSFSLSSSDEKEVSPITSHTTSPATVLKRANLALNTIPLQSAQPSTTHEVLLTIEDPKFAAVAASVTGHLLEDETSPVDSLISSCTDSEEITAAKHKEKSNKMTESNTSKDINEKALQSPGTPTNASLSLSDGKDFFDDEIADQPSLLVFDSEVVTSENTMVEEPSASKSKQASVASSPVHQRKVGPKLNQGLQRTGSLDTLSPCDSIASDDLMMDFEQSMSSGFDDSTDRLDSKQGSGYNSLDLHETKDRDYRDVRQEWSALLNKRNRKEGSPCLSTTASRSGSRLQQTLRCRAGGAEQINNVPDSPRSLDGGGGGSRSRITSTSSASHSPLRLSRRYMPTSSPTSGGQLSSTAYDSDDSIRLDRSTHGSMMQDIVGMKTMLLKLKRVLQESETLNPFESPLKNGHFNINDGMNNQSTENVGADERFELADLRRQVLFLQAQLEERERTVQQLRQQVADVTTSSSAPTSICDSTTEMCNAATQTDRIRPMSAGPSLLQGFPTDAAKGGPLVSMNNDESTTMMKKQHRRIPTPTSNDYYRQKQSYDSSLTTTATNPTSPPSTNLLRVFNQKKSSAESCVPNRISRPVSPAHPSAIPTRRSLSHSRIKITTTQYL
ncbi:uncharacterized protein LOC123290639 isoform X2 [Chrysoperla carnea]|uniref:uncharacterized protein LOC123290639 isoform X2 n=1 Tax=Chrysoperla carnea TaxID=189513 RepID=UPI001D078B6A|nr:uncharacterized protein LOC123290639 isoform X2 [Chrysoperla carnea]